VLVRSTVRSNWAASWSEFTTPVTVDPVRTPRLPRMSAGGSPLASMARIRSVAGETATVVPSDSVTWLRWKVGVDPLVTMPATTPPTRMKTARPRTMRAGVRTDIGS